MADEGTSVPRVSLPTETLVIEQRTGNQLLWLDGVLVLPLGARINLDNVPAHQHVPLDSDRHRRGYLDAVVVGMYLWGTLGDNRCLVLEVELGPPGSDKAAIDEAEAEAEVVEAAERIAAEQEPTV